MFSKSACGFCEFCFLDAIAKLHLFPCCFLLFLCHVTPSFLGNGGPAPVVFVDGCSETMDDGDHKGRPEALFPCFFV